MPPPLDPIESSRVTWRTRIVAVVVLAALAGAIAIGVISSGGPDDLERQRRERRRLEAFQERLVPLAQEWGRIEIQGMRPAIADLDTGQGVPAETVAAEARAWRAGFEDLRRKIASLEGPPDIRRVKELFDQAMARYLDATVKFENAADGPPETRRLGIEAGIAASRDGARLYNEGSMALQDARRRLGLEPTPDFPDHPAGRETVPDAAG